MMESGTSGSQPSMTFVLREITGQCILFLAERVNQVDIGCITTIFY